MTNITNYMLKNYCLKESKQKCKYQKKKKEQLQQKTQVKKIKN